MIEMIAILFIFGLCFGSFANVCIYRLQHDLSVVTPGSHCPSCKTPIRWYHNIPLISFIALRAKCAYCNTPISWRYPAIELLTGICFSLIGWHFWPSPLMYFLCFFSFILIVIAGIDYDTQLIPDILSYALAVIGLAAAPFNYLLGTSIFTRILQSGFGALTGAGSLLFIAFVGEKVFKKEAMGIGDVKLMLGIGAVVGIAGVFQTLFLASLGGALVGITMLCTGAMKRGDYLPFGPYLAAGGFLTLFIPQGISFIFY